MPVLTLAALALCLGLPATAGEVPEYSEELAEFSTPAFSVLLPKAFRNASKDRNQLNDSNSRNTTWLWGIVAAQPGRYSQEELEQFAQGSSCPKNQGQVVLHPKRVRTKNLIGVRFSCGTPDGKPYGSNPSVSGWTRIQANSPRFDRRYTLHLNYWADPRGKDVQKLIDRIVLSFKEKGGVSTVDGGTKKLKTGGGF
jgi:hypothetical protein